MVPPQKYNGTVLRVRDPINRLCASLECTQKTHHHSTLLHPFDVSYAIFALEKSLCSTVQAEGFTFLGGFADANCVYKGKQYTKPKRMMLPKAIASCLQEVVIIVALPLCGCGMNIVQLHSITVDLNLHYLYLS